VSPDFVGEGRGVEAKRSWEAEKIGAPSSCDAGGAVVWSLHIVLVYVAATSAL
jgi:hypothetical protein